MDVITYALLKNKIMEYTYDDTEIRQKLLKVIEDVNVIKGNGEGSISKTIADEITKIIDGAPENLNTLKELSDWINTHSESAADMNSRILQNTNDITAKFDKNQGSINSGKVAGIDESGEVVPMLMPGVTYNEETQCLEYNVDEKINLNAGIQLDETLSKSGYAADAAKVGELKGDLDEQKQIIHCEKWDISKGNDAELLDKTYLLASATTLEDSKASHDNFFTVVIKVNPNTKYYGFDEFGNSQVAGRFAGRIWFYDSNKNALLTISNPVDSVTTPDNCEYVAFFCYYTDKTTQTTGEYWFTDKEPNERKDRIVLCDKLDLSQIDLEVGEGLKITGNKISIVDSASESLKEVILKRFPTLPYKVYRDPFGGFVVEDILSNRNESFTTYYVDCENGLDTNNGTSRTSAYKTLKQALSKYATSNQHCIIQIIGNNPIFYSDDLYGELLVKKSLVIKSESKAKIICGIKPTFTTHNEYENVYVSNDLSGNNFTYCLNIDDSNHDNMGLYKPMTNVSSIALVDITPNSYFIENGVIYSSVNTLVALLNGYRWRFNHTLSTESHILYEENLNVIGALFYASRSAKSDDGKIIERVSKDCIYQHNVSGDGVPFSDCDVAYSINTKCGYTKADCFNHHASFLTEEQILKGVAVEVNCESEEAGFYRPSRTYTDNLFTAHEGINIVRFNVSGNHSDGPMVADVNGCRTIIVGCDVLNSKYDYTPSNNKGCYEFNNQNAVHDGFVTMQDCRGFDNRPNFKTLVSTVDTEINNCDVYNSFACDNLTVFNERI